MCKLNNSLVGSYIIQQEDEIFLVDLKNNKTKKCIVPKEITSLKLKEKLDLNNKRRE